MAVKKQACKNHPDQKTSRHCFQCHEPICKECQQHRAHHLFCSIKCFARWWTKEYLQPIVRRPDILIPVSLILLLQVILFLILSAKIDGLKQGEMSSSAVLESHSNDTTSSDMSGIWIDSSRHELKRTIQINLKIKDDALYSIWNDDIFVDASSRNQIELPENKYTLHTGLNSFTIWRMDGSGSTTLVDSFTIHLSSFRDNLFSRSINRIRTDEKVLAITFDGGSSNRGTEHLLAILDSLQIKSTIFLTGHFMKNFPELVKRITDSGHEVGNHSFSHPHLTSYEKNGLHETLSKVNREYLNAQLTDAEDLYKDITGYSMAPLWRAPYGEINQEILNWAGEMGYLHINWSNKCDSWDWVTDSSSQLYRTNQQMIDHFLKLEAEKGLQGKIILMHLSSDRSGELPYEILEVLSDSLSKHDYKFVTVGEMLKLSAKEHIYSKY
jgi:peptidoglycan/xylan/chitin deacetylase (PgdA/CDA1 family)